MTIKTYEIHNSYLQNAPDNAGITRMVSEADYISQLQQTDALQTSLNNIINAFGISGEGAHSKLVIEYVHGLVAENVSMRGAIEFAEPWLPSCDGELLHIISQAKITPATDEFTAELRAQVVDDFLNDEFVQEVAMRLADFNGETEESVSTVVWSGMPPEPEGNVWELEYVSRASFLSRKLKEFAANLRAGRKG